jgi:hypothetical protein
MTSPRDVRRVKAAIERENRVLGMIVAGKTSNQIAEEVGCHPGTVRGIVDRGLARRAEEMSPIIERARELHVERLTGLFAAWHPLATGTYEVDGLYPPPDVRAAEILIKIMDRLAAVSAGIKPPVSQTTTINNLLVTIPDDAGTARNTILAQLAATAAKLNVVDGELADAGTSVEALTGQAEYDARPLPPPLEGT